MPARPETLADLIAAAETPCIAVRCEACGRVGAYSHGGMTRLVERFGGSARIADLVRRFRCAGCGSRSVKVTAYDLYGPTTGGREEWGY